jgi:hypothetical protein
MCEWLSNVHMKHSLILRNKNFQLILLRFCHYVRPVRALVYNKILTEKGKKR